MIKAFALKLDPATEHDDARRDPGQPGHRRSPASPGRCRASLAGRYIAERDRLVAGRGSERHERPGDPPRLQRQQPVDRCSTPATEPAGRADTAGGTGSSFHTPTIANGHVYLGTAKPRLTPTDSSRRRAAARPPRCRVTRAPRPGSRPPPYSIPGAACPRPPPQPAGPLRPRREWLAGRRSSHRDAGLRPGAPGTGTNPP